MGGGGRALPKFLAPFHKCSFDFFHQNDNNLNFKLFLGCINIRICMTKGGKSVKITFVIFGEEISILIRNYIDIKLNKLNDDIKWSRSAILEMQKCWPLSLKDMWLSSK